MVYVSLIVLGFALLMLYEGVPLLRKKHRREFVVFLIIWSMALTGAMIEAFKLFTINLSLVLYRVSELIPWVKDIFLPDVNIYPP